MSLPAYFTFVSFLIPFRNKLRPNEYIWRPIHQYSPPVNVEQNKFLGDIFRANDYTHTQTRIYNTQTYAIMQCLVLLFFFYSNWTPLVKQRNT